MPAGLAGLIQPHTRGAPLRPVARIAVTRGRVILRGPGGHSLAEVTTDDISAQTMGESTAPR